MKTGLFLCGGGALGAWQSGVLRSLIENKIEVNVISGFSIGAINSAFYCFDSVDKTEKIWSKIDNKKIFRFSPSYSKPISISEYEKRKNIFQILYSEFEKILLGFSLFSNKPIYKILSRYISPKLGFKKDIKFYCISHCVETSSSFISEFDYTNYKRDDFIKMIIASSSIPFIFPPVKEKIDNKTIHLVDGGVIGKKYIDFSFFKNLDRVIVISNVCDEDKDFKMEKINFIDFFEKKVRRILFHHNLLIENHLKKINDKIKLHFIKPPFSLKGRAIDFNPSTNLRLYRQGFEYGSFYIREFINA